jgi:hypothetical protein
VTRRRKTPESTKLQASLAASADETVPVRWVKFVVALFLLPVAWILTQTFFGALAWMTVARDFWATAEFWFFGLGCIAWLLLFFSTPRPMWIYVFGHELTHAIWVWMMGGRVSKFEVSSRGGHILSDKVNTWIALAPYFFPIYSLLVAAAYAVTSHFVDWPYLEYVFFGLLGLTWAFHITFTLWMIPKGQPDLEYGGYFFSLVVIYIANLIVLSVLFILGCQDISWSDYFTELIHNTADLAHTTTVLIQKLL